MKKGMFIEPTDNVGVVLENIEIGDQVLCGDISVTALEPIAVPHKIALVTLEAGDSKIKYGAVVGKTGRRSWHITSQMLTISDLSGT